MRAHLTHTTLLLHSVDAAAKFFSARGFKINPPDTFESEGTREIYIGDLDHDSSKILLVEPFGEGSYMRALQKRGPGLHHIGVDVENLHEYCAQLGRAGWLLHTHSLHSIPKLKTAYLVRPGVPLMIEAQERLVSAPAPSLLTDIVIPHLAEHAEKIAALELENARILASSSTDLSFKTTHGMFSLKDILAHGAI